MIFLIRTAVLINFAHFLYWLPLFYGRRWIPDIWIFEDFRILIRRLVIWFWPIGTKSPVGSSKVGIISQPKAVIVLIDWIILVRRLLLLRFYNRTCIKVDSTQHAFDILDTVFFLDDFALK